MSLKETLERYQKEITIDKRGFAQETTRIKKWMKPSLSHRDLATLRSTDFANYRDERAKPEEWV